MKTIKSIYYHNPEAAKVESMIVWLQNRGYRFISIEEVYELLTVKKCITEKVVFLSFDDAWRNNLDLLPIIERYSIPITIFVPIEPLYSGNYWWEFIKCSRNELEELHSNNFVKKLEAFQLNNTLPRSCMSVDDIKILSNHPFVSLQAHSVHHPILTYINDDELYLEIKDAKERLECMINKKVNYFSYPNGSYSLREIGLVEQYYKMSFTIEQRHISLNDSLYELPRVCLTGDFIKDILKYYGIWQYLKKFVKIFK